LLKLVARHGPKGVRLNELTEQANLSRPTVHRLLQSLINGGLVRQVDGRRYELGTTLFELGLAAPSPVERLRELRPLIEELAHESGDTAFLAVRRGDEMLYLVRAEGSFPVRIHLIREGDRLPLPASAAGICLMTWMPESEVASIFAKHHDPEHFPWATEATIRQLMRDVQKQGYLLGENTVALGVTGLGMAVPSRVGIPYMGVSISAITSRVAHARIPKLTAMLKSTAEKISAMLA
jgi:DNA-binding IclR family transcriptional regulator